MNLLWISKTELSESNGKALWYTYQSCKILLQSCKKKRYTGTQQHPEQEYD